LKIALASSLGFTSIGLAEGLSPPSC
jgi:hypothetical protein